MTIDTRLLALLQVTIHHIKLDKIKIKQQQQLNIELNFFKQNTTNRSPSAVQSHVRKVWGRIKTISPRR